MQYNVIDIITTKHSKSELYPYLHTTHTHTHTHTHTCACARTQTCHLPLNFEAIFNIKAELVRIPHLVVRGIGYRINFQSLMMSMENPYIHIQ